MKDRLQSQQTAVVSGAEGFIGSSLVRELKQQGWSVVALHLPGANLMRLNGVPVTMCPCNILKPADLERSVPENVECMFHLAADVRITNRRASDQYGVNLNGTKNMIEIALRKNAKRFLYTSSMAAFGLHEERIDELIQSNAMQTPISYFQSKYLGELEIDKAIERGLNAVMVNPANVVGQRDINNMPAIYIRLVHQNRIPAIGPGRASFCHVEDVAKAMISCAAHGRTGERYLLGGADATYFELGEIIADVVGGRAPRLVLPGWALRAVGRALDAYAGLRGVHNVLTREMSLVLSSTMLVDCSKAIGELGYTTSTLKRMIEDDRG